MLPEKKLNKCYFLIEKKGLYRNNYEMSKNRGITGCKLIELMYFMRTGYKLFTL